MATNTTQIQVRIDKKTKNEARKVLEGIGLDVSSAIKIFFRQIINVGNLPFEIRDENGFTQKQVKELEIAIKEAKTSPKHFTNFKEIADDIFN